MPRRPETQGELVVDAHRTVAFEVTENDVATGKALKSRECPGNNGICRALKSEHPSLQNREIRVHLARTFIRLPVEVAKKEFAAVVPRNEEKHSHVWVRFANPPELRDQVHSMDRKNEFAPGKYALYTPPPPDHTARPKSKNKRPNRKAPKHLAPQRTLRAKVRKWGKNR